jgi:hypothetical protein
MKNIFVTNFDSHNLFKFSEFLYRNVHNLHLPVRVSAAIDTDSRAPLLLTNNYDNEGVHFVKKTRFCVVSQMSWLHMNLDKPFFWNHKGPSNTNLRCCHYYFGLLEYGLLYYNLRLRNLRLNDYLRSVNLRCLHDNLWTAMMTMEFRFEMNSSSRLSVEVDLNPFLSWTVLSEQRNWHVCFSNKRSS